ncbi:hypothetical protein GCM10022398_15410 [Acetobacter lovaniensis]|nr:hypothetical protein AA0474_0626 [Acetobacter lovaniensis NRIC 0474]
MHLTTGEHEERSISAHATLPDHRLPPVNGVWLPYIIVHPAILRKDIGHVMANLAEACGMAAKEVTVHGLRFTFRDWAAEETDYPQG